MFSTSIIEKLAYYVYCLIDPRDGNIFYVGERCGQSSFSIMPWVHYKKQKRQVIKLL